MWIRCECGYDQYWFNAKTKTTMAVISQYDDEGENYYSFTVNDAEVASSYNYDGILNIAKCVLNNSDSDEVREYKDVEPEELFRWIRE